MLGGGSHCCLRVRKWGVQLGLASAQDSPWDRTQCPWSLLGWDWDWALEGGTEGTHHPYRCRDWLRRMAATRREREGGGTSTWGQNADFFFWRGCKAASTPTPLMCPPGPHPTSPWGNLTQNAQLWWVPQAGAQLQVGSGPFQGGDTDPQRCGLGGVKGAAGEAWALRARPRREPPALALPGRARAGVPGCCLGGALRGSRAGWGAQWLRRRLSAPWSAPLYIEAPGHAQGREGVSGAPFTPPVTPAPSGLPPRPSRPPVAFL